MHRKLLAISACLFILHAIGVAFKECKIPFKDDVSRETLKFVINVQGTVTKRLCSEKSRKILMSYVSKPCCAYRAAWLLVQMQVDGKERECSKDSYGDIPSVLLMTREGNNALVSKMLSIARKRPELFVWEVGMGSFFKKIIRKKMIQILMKDISRSRNLFIRAALLQLSGDKKWGSFRKCNINCLRDADALYCAARILFDRGNRKKAYNLLNRLEKLSKKIGDQATLMRVLLCRAVNYEKGTNFDEQKIILKKILRIEKKCRLKEIRGRTLFALATLYAKENKFSKAVSIYREVISNREGYSKNIISASLINLGYVLDEMGFFDQALECYNSSLSYYERKHDLDACSTIFLNRGALKEKLNMYDEAAEDFKKVLRTECGERNRVMAQGNLALIYAVGGRWKKASAILHDAFVTAIERKWRDYALILGSNLSICYLEQGKLSESKDILERCKIVKSGYSESRAGFIYENAYIRYLQNTGREHEALTLLNGLTKRLKSEGYVYYAWNNNNLKGRVLAKLGRYGYALKILRRSLFELDRLESGCKADPVKELFFISGVKGVVEDILQICSMRKIRKEMGKKLYPIIFDTMERYRARVLKRQLASREKIQSSYWEPVLLKDVQKRLDDKRAVAFEYFVGYKNIYLLFMDGKDARFVIFKNAVDVEGNVRRAYENLVRSRNAAFLDGMKISSTTIMNIIEKIHASKLIYVLPDGQLFHVPWEVILFKNWEEWVLSKPTIYLFSWRQVSTSWNIVPKHNNAESFLGLYGTVRSERRGQEIGYTEAEIAEAAEYFNIFSARFIEGKSYSAGSDVCGGHWSIIHIASHMSVDKSRPWLSKIIWSKNKSTSFKTLRVKGLSGDLIYLSGCSSGYGQFFPGEGVVSVARYFLAAGSKAVLLTLWPVEDGSAYLFSKYFYRGLTKNFGSPAMALVYAKKKLSNTPQFGNPYFWACYNIYGECSDMEIGRMNRENKVYFVVSIILVLSIFSIVVIFSHVQN